MAVVSLSLNVLQDTVGDILLGGIRREVTICLGNMLAICATHLSLCEVLADIHYFYCTYVFVRRDNAFTDN